MVEQIACKWEKLFPPFQVRTFFVHNAVQMLLVAKAKKSCQFSGEHLEASIVLL